MNVDFLARPILGHKRFRFVALRRSCPNESRKARQTIDKTDLYPTESKPLIDVKS